MNLNRRSLLVGGAAGLSALAAPNLLRAAERAERRFLILRGDDEIGYQTTRVARVGDEVTVEVEANIVVKMLGIAVYRYEQEARTTWRNGRMDTLVARTNDDGEDVTARIARSASGLMAEGSDYSGPVPDEVGDTTYWNARFLSRSSWVSTQTGRPLSVRCVEAGTERVALPSGAVECSKWQVAGDIDLTLYYDAQGEWRASAFDAKGETARFVAMDDTGRLGPLWAA